MIDPKRREMFTDLYRLAEYYEQPPLTPGDIDGNAVWFLKAQEDVLMPFLMKWDGSKLAEDLARAVLDEADRHGAAVNKMISLL